MATGEKLRLFFAILPDDATRARLDDLARAIAQDTGGRASAPHTLHLTVVFVGTVDAEAAASVEDSGEAGRFAPCVLTLDRVGSFARAGIAWAAPSSPPPGLVAANRALVRALAERGVATEARAWRPHVTLARRCTRAIEAALDPPVAWNATRLVLMSSRLLSEGPRYREVAGWDAR